MRVLVLYDSAYGNTATIAHAAANAFRRTDKVRLEEIDGITPQAVKAADMVVVGSPTQGGRPTPKVQQALASLSPSAFRGKLVAAFDTRFGLRAHGFGLRMVMKVVGFAAPRIAASLQAKGGELVAPPEGFIVQDKEGPLKQGEIERVADWVRQLHQAAGSVGKDQKAAAA